MVVGILDAAGLTGEQRYSSHSLLGGIIRVIKSSEDEDYCIHSESTALKGLFSNNKGIL